MKIGDKPTLIKSYGFANEQRAILNHPEIVFDIGSITKQFTGAAILKLEMEGELSTDQTLSVFFENIPPDKAHITIHQLLTHTSGFPRYFNRDRELLSKEQFTEQVFLLPLFEVPGAKYQYSHINYSILGLIIEKVTKGTYEQYLENHLFKPAGMRHTGYILPRWSQDQVAHGYRNCKDWGRPMDLTWLDDGPYWDLRANGGMLSTALDLYAWHEALLGNEILDSRVKEKYYYPYIQEDSTVAYSYGWKVLYSQRGTIAYGHDGDNGKFYSDFLRYLEEKVTIIILSNKQRYGNRSISYEIARCIFKPGHEPHLQGQLTECLDTLPDNHIGRITGSLLQELRTGDTVKIDATIDKLFATHLINKYPREKSLKFLMEISPDLQQARLTGVRIFDKRLIDLTFQSPLYQEEIFFRIFLDENEDYKIRGFVYDNKKDNRRNDN